MFKRRCAFEIEKLLLASALNNNNNKPNSSNRSTLYCNYCNMDNHTEDRCRRKLGQCLVFGKVEHSVKDSPMKNNLNKNRLSGSIVGCR